MMLSIFTVAINQGIGINPLWIAVFLFLLLLTTFLSIFLFNKNRFYRQLSASQEQLDLILDSTNEGFIEISPKGIITRFNKALLKMTELEAKFLSGKYITDVFNTLQKDELRNILLAGKEDKSTTYILYYSCSSCIKTKQLKFNFTPIIANENFLGMFAIVSNITNQLRAEDEGVILKGQESAFESKVRSESMIPNMLYGLRSPINAILGFVELLASEPSAEIRIKYLETISNSGKHLTDMVNDLLDLARFENGSVKATFKESNVAELLKKMHTRFSSVPKAKHLINIDFQLHLPSNEIIVNTDEKRLKQVFGFLLTNAFNFTEEGVIEFGCSEATAQMVSFYVRDTGKGLPVTKPDKGDGKKINLPNENVNTELGLGLVLSQKIINQLGGDFKVESVPGSGTTIYFTIENKLKEIKV